MRVKPAIPTRSEWQGVTPDLPRAPQDYVTKNALAAIRPSTGALPTPQPACTSLARPRHCVAHLGMHARNDVVMRLLEEGQADLLFDGMYHMLNVWRLVLNVVIVVLC